MHPTLAMSLVAGDHCFSSLLLLTEQDSARVHPDDLSAVRTKYPQGWQLVCFRYCGQDSGYDVLEDDQIRARVQGAVIRRIPAPQFRRGDQVFVRPNQSIGTVRQVVWHLKRECVFYSLGFDGRRSGRWYFECDLAMPDEAEQKIAPDCGGIM